jgi:hypothetical protein
MGFLVLVTIVGARIELRAASALLTFEQPVFIEILENDGRIYSGQFCNFEDRY